MLEPVHSAHLVMSGRSVGMVKESVSRSMQCAIRTIIATGQMSRAAARAAAVQREMSSAMLAFGAGAPRRAMLVFAPQKSNRLCVCCDAYCVLRVSTCTFAKKGSEHGMFPAALWPRSIAAMRIPESAVVSLCAVQ